MLCSQILFKKENKSTSKIVFVVRKCLKHCQCFIWHPKHKTQIKQKLCPIPSLEGNFSSFNGKVETYLWYEIYYPANCLLYPWRFVNHEMTDWCQAFSPFYIANQQHQIWVKNIWIGWNSFCKVKITQQ